MSELGLDNSPFVIISVIGQEFLSVNENEMAISILRIAVGIDSPSLKLKQSTFGSLAQAYYKSKNFSKAIDYMELQLELAVQLSKFYKHKNPENFFTNSRIPAQSYCNDKKF